MDDACLDIPRRLADPPKLFLWDIDVALIFCACLVGGAALGRVETGVLLGLVLARLYAKFKSGKHQAYAIHLFYWHLPRALSPLRRCPPSDLREFIG